jgi:molybdenum cofactor cytidylyltransferase
VALVTGIVLAAGRSRRLGRPKQTLPFGDTTLLGWTLRNVEASSLDRVVLVLGGAADEVEAVVATSRAVIVRNDRFDEGARTSLLAGLDVAAGADAVMLLLGDMPGVDTAVIDAIAATWRRDRPWGAVASYRGELGHPVVFSAGALATVRTATGTRPVWKLVESRPEDVQRVAVDRALPRDVDTWDDYQDALRELGGPAHDGGG